MSSFASRVAASSYRCPCGAAGFLVVYPRTIQAIEAYCGGTGCECSSCPNWDACAPSVLADAWHLVNGWDAAEAALPAESSELTWFDVEVWHSLNGIGLDVDGFGLGVFAFENIADALRGYVFGV